MTRRASCKAWTRARGSSCFHELASGRLVALCPTCAAWATLGDVANLRLEVAAIMQRARARTMRTRQITLFTKAVH